MALQSLKECYQSRIYWRKDEAVISRALIYHTILKNIKLNICASKFYVIMILVAIFRIQYEGINVVFSMFLTKYCMWIKIIEANIHVCLTCVNPDLYIIFTIIHMYIQQHGLLFHWSFFFQNSAQNERDL